MVWGHGKRDVSHVGVLSLWAHEVKLYNRWCMHSKAISGKDSPSSIPSPLTGEGEGGGERAAQGTRLRFLQRETHSCALTS